MQQHTGQHILSQAFLRGLNADTIGFHLGETAATIDVSVSRLSWTEIQGVETEANGVIFADLPVRVTEVADETNSRIPMRKAPAIKGTIRMVEIGDYDGTACCGTHVRATGEIGLIKVVRFEKYKTGVRVTFVCRHRALSAFQSKTEVLEIVARRMALGETQLVEGVQRLLDSQKRHQKTLKALEKKLLVKEAEEWMSRGRRIGEFCFVTGTVADLDLKSVRTLGLQITENPKTVCLLGVSAEPATIIVGQSADGRLDLKSLTPYVAALLAGKGGGNSRQIQVSGADVSRPA